MPKHQFRNENNKIYELLPEGDYILEVVKGECGLSNGATTRGSDQVEIEVKSLEHGAKWREWLIFHPNTDWKVDNFLKCMNFGAAEGEEVEITEENVVGLRGWARVGVKEKAGKKYNEVRVWYTDKEKLPRAGRALELPPEKVEEIPWSAH